MAEPTTKLEEVSSHRFFEGSQKVYKHRSEVLKCDMKFGVYLPPGYQQDRQEGYPLLYFLSGLTCTEDNFIIKSGMQRFAAKHGFVVINPDTSPRESNHPGEHDDYDFGSAAGFYLNATQEPWSQNYHMYDYIVNECLVAISPISNPCLGKWGIKAFTNYLGPDKSTWKEWDATELARGYTGPTLDILVDQGAEDRFLTDDLMTGNFIEVAEGNAALNVDYRLREGYDHFYPYICTFIEEQFDYVAERLKTGPVHFVLRSDNFQIIINNFHRIIQFLQAIYTFIISIIS
eukprot:sb/3467668/